MSVSLSWELFPTTSMSWLKTTLSSQMVEILNDCRSSIGPLNTKAGFSGVEWASMSSWFGKLVTVRVLQRFASFAASSRPANLLNSFGSTILNMSIHSVDLDIQRTDACLFQNEVYHIGLGPRAEANVRPNAGHRDHGAPGTAHPHQFQSRTSMARNGEDEDLCEQFHREASDRGEEAGGFGIFLVQDMDLHFDDR
jgi:hypothetical protein